MRVRAHATPSELDMVSAAIWDALAQPPFALRGRERTPVPRPPSEASSSPPPPLRRAKRRPVVRTTHVEDDGGDGQVDAYDMLAGTLERAARERARRHANVTHKGYVSQFSDEAVRSWSPAQLRAWALRHANPNAFYYRFTGARRSGSRARACAWTRAQMMLTWARPRVRCGPGGHQSRGFCSRRGRSRPRRNVYGWNGTSSSRPTSGTLAPRGASSVSPCRTRSARGDGLQWPPSARFDSSWEGGGRDKYVDGGALRRRRSDTSAATTTASCCALGSSRIRRTALTTTATCAKCLQATLMPLTKPAFRRHGRTRGIHPRPGLGVGVGDEAMANPRDRHGPSDVLPPSFPPPLPPPPPHTHTQ